MTTASVRKAVETTLETLRQRTPAYDELADRFEPLFITVARLCDEFTEKGVATPEVDSARLAAGVPVLADLDLTPWKDDLIRSAKKTFPELAEVLGLNEEEEKALLGVLSDPETVSGLVQARIEGDLKYFENIATKPGMPPSSALMYSTETVAAPVLCALAHTLDDPFSSVAWEHGSCPVCGSSPSISHLSPKEVTDLDQLVGGGGRKYLHCSLCGHDWRFKRNACPSCGNDENETREVFYSEKARYERVEACHKCGKYCLNIDLREFEPHPHLDAVQIGLIHLDMFARENRLSPLVSTLWNNLD